MILPRRCLALLALLLCAAPASAAEFFSVIEDLPVAEGLVEHADDSVVFESAAGRIVTVVASGDVAPASVHAFYSETLPALGWERERDGVFRRDGARLTIETAPADDGTRVLFRLVPVDP